ncbi:hypothetical protein FB567DRAFT_629102 [Paraphoma chrysanthemicola]|uniref:NACHT-NTPase and P-loop NTPases N-terminal domain-containing protein n=1 Tax=Paraphoma chrysanthemicola TaxID=798071 RepID=A0A8K0R805_9PLEO|nr:hypothetical protein FB567DRAFT_629102 [Paraphoma chrysanthemicola]
MDSLSIQLGIQTSIIAIDNSFRVILQTIESTQGLPRELGDVQNYFPVVSHILRSTQAGLVQGQYIKADGQETSVATLQAIRDKAEELQIIYVGVKNDIENGAKLNASLNSRVEQLMLGILNRTKELALSKIVETISEQDIESLEKVIQALSQVDRSLLKPADKTENDPEVVNDDTQYTEYAKIPTPNNRNFPVSEKSVESHTYTECLSRFVSALEQNRTEWQSIDCLGRNWLLDDGKSKIRTTVVIAFSPMPNEEERVRLKTTLENIMGDVKLCIEFIERRVTDLYGDHYLAMREPQSPLVCGASGAPGGKNWSGTIGGFITITGDPDSGAVYAVTNHHVVKNNRDSNYQEPIVWPSRNRIVGKAVVLNTINQSTPGTPHPSDKEFFSSRTFEHPSGIDRKEYKSRLEVQENLAKELSKLSITSKNKVSELQRDSERELHEADAIILREQRLQIERYETIPGPMIGITWVSSGKQTWKTSLGHVTQDWALVRLFKDNGEKFHNTISNMTRPRQPTDHFRAVMPWSRANVVEVCKRGRTTNHTVGKTNGAPSLHKRSGVITSAYAVISMTENPFFSLPGDSGAWLMDRAGQLVGMMFSGRTNARNLGAADSDRVYVEDVEDVTYFTPADYLFQMVQERFEKAMRDQKVNLSGTFRPGERINLYSDHFDAEAKDDLD